MNLYFVPIGQKDLPLCVFPHCCLSIHFAIDEKKTFAKKQHQLQLGASTFKDLKTYF
jgi:hypothetical protein